MDKLPIEILKGMGYDPTQELVKKEDAVFNIIFGGIAGAPLNWKSFLTPRELQGALPFCVSFSRTNCAEAKGKKEGVTINFSDRNLAVGSETNKVGNSLQAVAEYARKTGIVDEMTCPLTPQMISDGTLEKNWKEVFDLSHIPLTAFRYKLGNHSWVYGFEAIKQALAYSPVQIAVGVVGNWEGNGVIMDDNKYYSYHAITVYSTNGEYGEAYYIQDSVGKEFKVLDKNYKIQGAKSFADLPEDWKEAKFTFELTTEMARFAWLKRPDLRTIFPSSNRFTSLDGKWNLYDWCFKFGPAEMPDVFLKNILNWAEIKASDVQFSEAKQIVVKKNDSLISKVVEFIKQLFKQWKIKNP